MPKRKPESPQTPRIIIDGLYAHDNGGAGVSISADGPPIQMRNVHTARNRGGGFVVRDRPSALEQLGLPADVPLKHVRDLLELVLRSQSTAPETRTELVRRSAVASWLAKRGLDVASFAANMVTIWTSPQVRDLLAAFASRPA